VRRFLLAIILSAAAAAANAQQPAASPLTGKQTNVVGAQSNVAGRVLDLKSRSLDLNFPVQAMGSKTVDLQVKETKTEIRISLAADVLFDFDKSNIKKEAATALKNVAAMIREHAGVPVRVEGYTDAKGSYSYNQRLSEQRANSVKTWLATKEGLKGTKFSTKGFGAKNPIAPNTKPDGSDDPDGRQKNRRVEIVIQKG
jgi:outer membrane protein OmpA-like peptidoglycan-associated protein